jgi:CO/xanthine dehydrogenase Mo-binding subunit
MTPRPPFVTDTIKFKVHELAERLGMTASECRRRMTVGEMIDWMGYDRYKAALEDQARERVTMEREAKRKPARARKR